MLIQFNLVADPNGKESVWIDPDGVVSVREYEDRLAYGGYFPASEIGLNNGKSFRVHGHVGETIRQAHEQLTV